MLSSCASNPTISNKENGLTQETNNIFEPEPGKSIIYGKLISESTSPQEGVVVRLAKVYGGDSKGGAYVLDDSNSPKAITDENGEYYFFSLLPGEYVLIVGNLDSNFEIINKSDNEPIVYSISPGEVLQIDPVIISFE